jgi:hypothetical protein
MKTNIIFIIFIIVITIIFPSKAAAAALDLGILPTVLQIDAIGPADITSPITVQNLSETPVTLGIIIAPFKPSPQEDGTITYLKENESIGQDPLILQKIQVVDNDHVVNQILIGPKQEKSLKVHIGILQGDPPSDYNFSILFISKQDDNTQKNGARSTAGIGTNVLLSVGPKQVPKGTIEEFSAPQFIQKGPVPFIVRLKNNGNKRFSPSGFIFIKNMFGQTVGKVTLLPVNVLGQSTRSIPDSTQADQNSLDTKYQIPDTTSPVALWPESFLLGMYTATLNVSLSDEGPVFNKKITFFAFPVEALFGLSLTASIVVLIGMRIKAQKRRNTS